MQYFLYPQRAFLASNTLSRANSLVSDFQVSIKQSEREGPSIQDLLPDCIHFMNEYSFSSEIFELGVRFLNDEWNFAKPESHLLSQPKRKIAHSFSIKITFFMPPETNSRFLEGGRRAHQPYGRKRIPEVEEEKEEEPVDMKNVLLTQKRNLDNQLKKLKVKIKKLKRKGLGPTQEVMLETWTMNTDKLKAEIEEITAKINELSPEDQEQKESKETEDRFQAEALLRWKKAVTEAAKVVEPEVNKSTLLLREMIGAMNEIEGEIKAKHLELRQIRNFCKKFSNEWDCIIKQEEKLQLEIDGKLRLEQVVQLRDPVLQPAVDVLFASFKDHYVVFDEVKPQEGRKYLQADKYQEYATDLYKYQETPFLKRIVDNLEFDPRLTGIVGFVFQNFGVVTVADQEVHNQLRKEGYKFIDPYNGLVYDRGSIKSVELKSVSEINKMTTYFKEKQKINEKTDNIVKILKQAERKQEEIIVGIRERNQSLKYFTRVVFNQEVDVVCAMRKLKQFSDSHYLTTEKYLHL